MSARARPCPEGESGRQSDRGTRARAATSSSACLCGEGGGAKQWSEEGSAGGRRGFDTFCDPTLFITIRSTGSRGPEPMRRGHAVERASRLEMARRMRSNQRTLRQVGGPGGKERRAGWGLNEMRDEIHAESAPQNHGNRASSEQVVCTSWRFCQTSTRTSSLTASMLMVNLRSRKCTRGRVKDKSNIVKWCRVCSGNSKGAVCDGIHKPPATAAAAGDVARAISVGKFYRTTFFIPLQFTALERGLRVLLYSASAYSPPLWAT